MSEKLALNTIAGIYDFCDFCVQEEDIKKPILNHISNIFKNWNESWTVIRKWLLEIQFENKEYDLLNFIQKIPELKIFQSVILSFLKYHSDFWDTVYDNLKNCKTLLNTE